MEKNKESYSIAGDMFVIGVELRELFENIKEKIKNLISKK